jgi:hypothetical protein
MVDITFEISGETVEPHEMNDALDVMFLEHLHDKISNGLESVQCKKHGCRPRITVKGQSLDSLTYEVSGCCPELIAETQDKIK